MRLRGAVFWFVIFVALLVYALWRERGEIVQGKLVLNLNPDDIVKVEVRRQQAPKRLVLERKGKSWWLTVPVKAPADPMTMEGFLNRFKNLTTKTELDEKKPEYGLANPTVILTVYDRRGRSYRIQFGNKTPDKMEAYALVEGWRKPVVLTAWLLDDANKSPDDSRDKRLVVFRKEKVTKLALIYPDRRIICERKGKEEWQLKEPIRTAGDNAAITSLLDRLSNLQARQFVVERPQQAQLVSFQLDKPSLQVQLWLKGRKEPLVLTVGKRHEAQTTRYYARSARFPAD